MIRDGREVAASLAEQSWGPGHIVDGAFYWRRAVKAGRTFGQALPAARYCEVRLEDLIAQPAATLERVCGFLGETYLPDLLNYPARVDQLRVDKNQSFAALWQKPTAGLRDWRRGLAPLDQRAVESVCAGQLAAHGYGRVPRSLPALGYAGCRHALFLLSLFRQRGRARQRAADLARNLRPPAA